MLLAPAGHEAARVQERALLCTSRAVLLTKPLLISFSGAKSLENSLDPAEPRSAWLSKETHDRDDKRLTEM